MPPSATRSFAAAALLGAVLVATPAAAAEPAAPDAAPRELSGAERATVPWVLAYLERGPAALIDVLDPLSPLAKLDPADAARELAVRAGPPGGSRWELATVVPSLKDRTVVWRVGFPSGMDETLLFQVVADGGAFRLREVDMLSEPSRLSAAAELPRPGAAGGDGAKETSRPGRIAALTVVLAFLGASFLTGAVLRREPVGRAVLGVSGLALLVTAWIGFKAWERASHPPPRAPRPPAEAWSAGARLGDLLPLREALATGTGSEAEKLLSGLPRSGPVAEVARLWSAQRALSEMDLARAGRLLDGFPPPSRIPLAEVLRARLLALTSRESDAAVAYERAINLGPGQDALWWEAAQAFDLLGFQENATAFLRRLARIGSREAGAWYALAAQAAREKRPEEGERFFRTGWRLAPLSRRALFRSGALWAVASRPAIYPTLLLDQPGEPAYATVAGNPAPLTLPAGAVARLTASELRVSLGRSEMTVPGGAALAPEGILPSDAGAGEREEERRALASLPRLTTAALNAGALTQPLLRREVEAAVSALVKAGRFEEIVALTAGFPPRSESVPLGILFRKAEALRKTQRVEEARAFLAELTDSPAVTRSSTPVVLFSLAELLVSVERYDEAIRLLERVAVRVPNAGVEDRLRQVRMEKRLAGSNEVLPTDHFDVVYPPDRGAAFARRIGELLEAERRRLLALVPLTGPGRRTTVQVLPWDEFAMTWATVPGVVGIYDGKIRLPLGGVRELVPEVVAIVSHELAHAMLAELTEDRAPRWLQEGVAQHAEMVRLRSNPVPGDVSRGRFLSLSSLDAVLEALPDPSISERAYQQAFWWVAFVERTGGRSALQRLLLAHRDGAATSEEAIGRVFGDLGGTFQRRFLDWCSGPAPKVWTMDVLRYDDATAGIRAVGTPKPRKTPEVPDSLRPPPDEW
ncbi:MAG: hypothetical protein EDX89_07445 [Acidobacteria bacterium]|nr:MAG: hypothetical protein EDX89_07445 [Acidobacteriota bacterium]